MALLLETTLGDVVVDLDIEGSPEICKNVLKLAKARYFTSTLVFNVQPNRFCQLGDPQGDGSGGACIYGLISTLLASEDGHLHNQKVLQSQQRFLKSNMGRPLTREECQEKGRIVATEMKGVADTIGSQLLITISEGQDMALDGFNTSAGSTTIGNGEDRQLFRSVGVVREDENNVLDQIAATYCDADGRPYADIRVIRALIIDDPFDDPPGMDQLLRERGVEINEQDDRVIGSPEYERPPEEKVEIRIQADQVDPLTGEDDLEKMREQEEEIQKREDKSRAVVLEMLGDLPDADVTAPENVLFVCKLNPITEDEDLELIFSRFDEHVKCEIIRDQDTGSSLQYAFIEFTSKDQAVEAYFKMNNALVDDRRIRVDFSQSVAKVWNKFSQRMKNPSGNRSNQHMPKDPFSDPKTQAPRNGGQQRPRNFKQGRPNYQQHRPTYFAGNTSGHNRNHAPRPAEGHGESFRGRGDEDLDAFERRRPQPSRDHNNHDDSRKDYRDRSHKHDRHHDDRKSRRHDSDSGSKERVEDSRRRHRSHSSERRHRKRSHKQQKSDRKRSRDYSTSDDDRSRDAERHRHRKRERHDGKDSSDRRDRSGGRRSSDRSDTDRDRDRSRDRRRHDERKTHHRDDRDRDHRRRSDHKDGKERHR